MSVPGPKRRVEVGHRRRAGEARVHHDELGLVLDLGLDHPLEAAGVGLGGVAAHDDDDVGVLDVHPVVGHRAATERGGQTGHRGPCQTRAWLSKHARSERADDLVGDVAGLVGGGGGGQQADGRPAVDRRALSVLRGEVLVAVVLHQPGDPVERQVPGDALRNSLRRAARYSGYLRRCRAVDEVEQRRALRAEGAAVDRMVRVALDMDDLGARRSWPCRRGRT